MPHSAAEHQNAFHRALTRLVNGGRPGRVASEPAVQARPEGLVRAYRQLRDAAPEPAAPVTVDVAPYEGDNAHVRRLGAYLRRALGGDLARDLAGAYVHGSLGSYEEVPYSDLDALVILNDGAFRSPARLARTARALGRARAFMYAHDPLQHHGWFVLTEADLRSHCEAYFPAVLFRYAKSLLPGQGERLTLWPRDSSRETLEAFRSLAAAVAVELDRGRPPADLYALKNLLSRFMLLPSLYVQVRDGEGVWKADSFDRARPDFPRAEWDSMEVASHIRAVWRYRLPGVQRRLMASAAPWGGYLRKRLPTPIPKPIAALLTRELLGGMAGLVARMQRRVEAGRHLSIEPSGAAS